MAKQKEVRGHGSFSINFETATLMLYFPLEAITPGLKQLVIPEQDIKYIRQYIEEDILENVDPSYMTMH